MQSEQFEITAAMETRHWWFTARRSILRAVAREVLPASRARIVLDIGCGTGANAASFDEDYTCYGVDRSAEAIGLARRRFPRTHFVCGEAPQDTSALIERADLVLLADVLEHVEDDRGVLSAIMQDARFGAYLLLTVPADMSLWSRHDKSHGHYRRYDSGGFAQLWMRLPVRVILLSYFNARLYPLVKAARIVGRIRGKPFGAAETDLSLPPRPLNRLLERTFAGETNRLLALLRGRSGTGYRRGVSLIALLQRTADHHRTDDKSDRSSQCVTQRLDYVGRL